MINLVPCDGQAIYYSNYLPEQMARELVEHLKNDILWCQNEIKIFGKTLKEPRLSYWMGDDLAKYRYSGKSLIPKPWTPPIFSLAKQIERDLNRPFNSVLLNYYRNGSDYMGAHSDNEKELGDNPTIASINLGVTRVFRLIHKFWDLPSIDIELEHASLLIMSGSLQNYWKHALPKRLKEQGPRFNLTFRYIQTLPESEKLG